MINTVRHDPLFDWRKFTPPIHIIGNGGLGGYTGDIITQLGTGVINENHLWDFDVVSEVNPPNQIFLPKDIGRFKTETLAEYMRERNPATNPIVHTEEIAKGKDLSRITDICRAMLNREYTLTLREMVGCVDISGIVFIMVDKMSIRGALMAGSIAWNPNVQWVIEARIEARNILIHAFDPCNERHLNRWVDYFYPDAEATNTGGCGGHISIATTVRTASAVATDQMIRWAAVQQGFNDVLDNQIRISMQPIAMETYQW